MSNLCDGMNGLFNKEMSKFRSMKGGINSKVNDLKNKMNVMDSSSTDTSFINNKINEAKSSVNSQMNEIKNITSGLAGSCLDGIMDKISNTSNKPFDFISGLIPTMPETDVFNGMGGLGIHIQGLGLSNIIGKIDELLGCLSSSDCIPIEEIDGHFSEIDNFLDINGLTDSGDFDMDTFMTKMDVSQKIKTGVNDLKSNMGDLQNVVGDGIDSAKSSIQEAKPKVSVPKIFF